MNVRSALQILRDGHTLARWLPLLVITACACPGEPLVEGRPQAVIGGRLVEEPGAEGAVLIRARGLELECTGVAIAPRVVLTAGHCVGELSVFVDPEGPETFELDVASAEELVVCHGSTVEAGPCGVGVAAVHVHPEFASSPAEIWGHGSGLIGWHDLAVLITRDPLQGVAQMTLEEVDLSAGTVLTVTGYGHDSNDASAPAELRQGRLTLVELTERELLMVDPDALAFACHGDSGGPVTLKDAGIPLLVGLVSRKRADAEDCAEGAIATLVTPYLDWITAVAGDELDPGRMPTEPSDGGLAPEASPDPASGCAVTEGHPGPALCLLVVLLFGRGRSKVRINRR